LWESDPSSQRVEVKAALAYTPLGDDSRREARYDGARECP